MDIYEQIHEQINNNLREQIVQALEANQIPYNFNSTDEDDYFVTFFVTNCDLALPKKLKNKHRLANPKVDIVYTFLRDFNFSNVISNPAIGQKMSTTNLMYIFNDLANPEWQIPISNTVKTWSRFLIGKLSIYYKEKYGIQLAKMPIEIWIKSPNQMYISKIPTFDDLIFVSSDKNYVLIENSNILESQVEIVSQIKNQNFPFRKDTDK